MPKHEIDPMALAKKDTPEKDVLTNEKEPSHEEKLAILYPRALEMVRAHNNRVVPRVEELLKRHKTFEKFPEKEVEKLIYPFGDQTEMIEAIIQAIEEEQAKN